MCSAYNAVCRVCCLSLVFGHMCLVCFVIFLFQWFYFFVHTDHNIQGKMWRLLEMSLAQNNPSKLLPCSLQQANIHLTLLPCSLQQANIHLNQRLRDLGDVFLPEESQHGCDPHEARSEPRSCRRYVREILLKSFRNRQEQTYEKSLAQRNWGNVRHERAVS